MPAAAGGGGSYRRCVFGGCQHKPGDRSFGTLGDTLTTYRKMIVGSEDVIAAGLNGRDPDRRVGPRSGHAGRVTPAAGGVGRLPASMVTPASAGNLPDAGTALPDYDGLDADEAALDEQEVLAAADADPDIDTDAEPVTDADIDADAETLADVDIDADVDTIADVDADTIEDAEPGIDQDAETLAAADPAMAADMDADAEAVGEAVGDPEEPALAGAGPHAGGSPGIDADVVAAAGMVGDAGRIAVDWARERSLTPTSIWGISVLLAFCATAWFSAGTREDNFRAVAALWAAYLVAIAARKMTDWPQAPRRFRASVARRITARTRWLGALAWSAAECAIYAGLAAGAAAEHWSGVWTLAVAVVGVVAIRDLMSAVSRPAQDAPHGAADPGTAWSVLWRGVNTFLSMPAGGRVLLVGIVAPTWGCRATLLALIDWGVISIVYGLVARPGSAGRRAGAGSADEEADSDGARTRGRRLGRRRAKRALGRQAEGLEESGAAARRQEARRQSGLVVLLQPDWVADDVLGAVDEAAEARTEAAGAALAEETEAALAEVAESGLAGPMAAEAGHRAQMPGEAESGDGEPVPGEAEPGHTDSEAEAIAAAEAEQAAEEADAAQAAQEGETARAAAAAKAAEAAAQRAARLRTGQRTRRLRDDGAIARFLGELVRGNFVPLPPAILGLAATVTLTYLGLHSLPAILIMTPPLIMLLAAPGSSNAHAGRLDWLVPAVLLGWQILYLGAIGAAESVPGPATFALCAVLLLRYTDLAFPGRPVATVEPRMPGDTATERGTMLGWEGRMLLMGAGVAVGIGLYAYLAMAAYLAMLICAKILTSCLGIKQGDGT